MINKWIVGVLGLVASSVPFLALTEITRTWTLVITGLVIIALSFGDIVSASTEIQGS